MKQLKAYLQDIENLKTQDPVLVSYLERMVIQWTFDHELKQTIIKNIQDLPPDPKNVNTDY